MLCVHMSLPATMEMISEFRDLLEVQCLDHCLPANGLHIAICLQIVFYVDGLHIF
jgi:hypothetical protein